MVRVMQEAPVSTLGGTQDSLRLLPKLKWVLLAEPRVYALPLTSRFVRRKLRRRPRRSARRRCARRARLVSSARPAATARLAGDAGPCV
jgi:hypothetical protein